MSAFFALAVFEIGPYFVSGPQSSYFVLWHVAGMTGAHHHTHPLV
jgi:hypothetical protein